MNVNVNCTIKIELDDSDGSFVAWLMLGEDHLHCIDIDESKQELEKSIDRFVAKHCTTNPR